MATYRVWTREPKENDFPAIPGEEMSAKSRKELVADLRKQGVNPALGLVKIRANDHR